MLTQLRRWQEAYDAWEQLMPLLGDQHDRREEARTQLRRLKAHLGPESAPQPEAQPTENLQQN